jgi:hypothetical protein
MDLTFGSLNFRVGFLGLIRLSDPTKSGSSVEKTASMAMSESSVGSSSEVNSPVSFTPTENIGDTIEELDEIMENLDLEETSDHSDKGSSQNFGKSTITDFTTQNGGVSDIDESTWRSEEKYISNIHQVCVIITEAVEDNDGRNNLVINIQGGNPENNHRKEKEKVYVLAGEWRTIMSAINHDTGIPADSRREVLMGYQYALHQHKKKLLQEKSELPRSHESNSTSSRSQREEYNETSESSEERNHEPKHNRRRTEWSRKGGRMKNLNSFLTADEEENIITTRKKATRSAPKMVIRSALSVRREYDATGTRLPAAHGW